MANERRQAERLERVSREAVYWAERWGTKWAIQYVEAALLANAYERTTQRHGTATGEEA